MLTGSLHPWLDDVAHTHLSGGNRFAKFQRTAERDKRRKSFFDNLVLPFLDQLRQPDFLCAAQQRNQTYILEVTDDGIWCPKQRVALGGAVQLLNVRDFFC